MKKLIRKLRIARYWLCCKLGIANLDEYYDLFIKDGPSAPLFPRE